MKPTIIILTLLAASSAWGRDCSNRPLRGSYAFLGNGMVLVPGTPITGPFYRVGSVQLDGGGGATFSTLAVYNGINFGPENFSGTYTVSSDCTIDLNVAVPAPIFANVEFKGQVSEDGSTFTFLLFNTDSAQAPPITTVAGFGKKRFGSNCTAADLAGTWRFEFNGVRNLPPLGMAATQYRQIGEMQVDGKSALTLSLISSDNGKISEETATGTYTVNSDCTFDLNYKSGGAPVTLVGSLSGFGQEAYIAYNPPGMMVPNVGLVNGAVATGTMNKQTIFPSFAGR